MLERTLHRLPRKPAPSRAERRSTGRAEEAEVRIADGAIDAPGGKARGIPVVRLTGDRRRSGRPLRPTSKPAASLVSQFADARRKINAFPLRAILFYSMLT